MKKALTADKLSMTTTKSTPATTSPNQKDNKFFQLAQKAAADGEGDGDLTLLEQMVQASAAESTEMKVSKRPKEDNHHDNGDNGNNNNNNKKEEEEEEEAEKANSNAGMTDPAMLSAIEKLVYYEDHQKLATSNSGLDASGHMSFDDVSDDGVKSVSTHNNNDLIHSLDELMGPEAQAFIKQIIAREFPATVSPCLQDLLNVGHAYEGANYKPGDWIELQGPDMKWRCEMVTRVLKLAPDDWDWNDPANAHQTPPWLYFYHAADQRMLQGQDVRSPKEGLLRIFGQRPWVWQQWACLKLESALRFQLGHQFDFMSKDVMKYALDLWDGWLNHPDNADFKAVFEDDRVGDRGRKELLTHIMTPFDIIRRIQDDREEWNFEEEKSLSVFTYLGILGSGFLIPLGIVILQIAAPALLIWNQIQGQRQARDQAMPGDCVEDLLLFGFGFKCPPDHVAESMAIVVLFYYIIKVVPNVFYAFYTNAGGGDDLYSRLVSMRRDIWIRGDDRWEQKIGFRIDEYMNTAYVAGLFMLNMFIIINSQSAFDILLNALAFEFIAGFDEEFVDSPWWDPDRRWISAGAMEMVLQEVLQKRVLSNAKAFSDAFGIPVEEVEEAADYDRKLLMNRDVAARDQQDPTFMSSDEIVKSLCLRVALETRNKEAIKEYQQPVRYFGRLMKELKKLFGVQGGGVFDRNGDFRTWSRWERFLYLPKVPSLDDTVFIDENHRVQIRKNLQNIMSTPERPFANLDNRANFTEEVAFMLYYLEVITFRLQCKLVYKAFQEGDFFKVLYRIIDGLFQWMAFLLQLFFPVYSLILIFGMFITLVTGL